MHYNKNNLSWPRICISIVVRNGEKTISDTLTSLLKQDYPNYEILVCDNLSTDDTKKIIDGFLSDSSIKITYLLNPIQGTAEDNWNFLLNNLPDNIEYFTIYHADDIYSPSIISKQFKLLEEKKVGAVFTQSLLIDENGNDITNIYDHQTALPKEIIGKEVFDYKDLFHYTLKYHNLVRTPTFFFKKTEIRKHDVYFDTQYKTSSDLEFWLRIAQVSKIAILNEPLLLYRISKKQGTYVLLRNRTALGDFFTVMDSYLAVSDTNDDAVKWYNAHKCIELIFCAFNLTKEGKKTEAKVFLKKAISIGSLSKLFRINKGAVIYAFGVLLMIAISLGLQKHLIKIIEKRRRF